MVSLFAFPTITAPGGTTQLKPVAPAIGPTEYITAVCP